MTEERLDRIRHKQLRLRMCRKETPVGVCEEFSGFKNTSSDGDQLYPPLAGTLDKKSLVKVRPQVLAYASVLRFLLGSFFIFLSGTKSIRMERVKSER